MSTDKKQTRKTIEADAKAYIDGVLAISRKHGTGNDVPAPTYEAAVAKATRLFEALDQAAQGVS